MSTILFLGAGCSKAFEYPTTVEFLQKVRGQLQSVQAFELCLSFLESVHQRKIVDIELVLDELAGVKEAIEGFRTPPGKFKEWIFFNNSVLGDTGTHANFARSISDVIARVNNLVYDAYWHEDYDVSNEVMRSFFQRFPEPLDIFSTNYDLVVENCFWNDPRSLETFSDGFRSSRVEIIWDPSDYADARYRLYKLHGSLNWKKLPGKKIGRFNRHDIYDAGAQVMLYPGFKGKPDGPPFDHLHQLFRNKLSEADVCIVIGFSFRDDYINSIFRDAIQKNKTLKILVWNPDASFAIDLPQSNLFRYPRYFKESEFNGLFDILKREPDLKKA